MLVFDLISEAGTKNWFEKTVLNSNRKEFMICLVESDESIGFTSIKNIDLVNSKAEISMLIGNKNYWGKGYAKLTRKLLLSYAFDELGLNKIYTYNLLENKKIIGLNKKFGFKIEGELREDIFFKGQFRTRVIMGILKKDWHSLNTIKKNHN